jgi:hypothetical protein
MKNLLPILLSFIIFTTLQASPFDNLKPISYIHGYVPADSSFIGYRGATILMKGEAGWLLLGDGNGMVWKLEGNHWKRIDDTFYAGYNFGSFPFISGLNIYKYGGYGFWKSNGILTLFDLKKKEWEPVPLNREIPSVQRFAFFDNQNQLLYQLGSLDFNQSVNNTSIFKDSLFVLDLAGRTWNSKGAINRKLLELNPSRFFEQGGMVLPTEKGFIYLSDNSISFAVDFRASTFTLFSAQNNTLIKKIYDARASVKSILVSESDGISLYDSTLQNKLQHISWNSLFDRECIIAPLIEQTAVNSYAFFIIPGVLLLAISGFVLKRKGKNEKLESKARRESHANDTQPVLTLLDGDFKISDIPLSTYLTKEEMKVLEALSDAILSDRQFSTIKLNEVLEIDNRSSDSQKNYRGEIIKSINEKVKRHETLSSELIIRQRSKDDKRMMNYQCSISVKNG